MTESIIIAVVIGIYTAVLNHLIIKTRELDNEISQLKQNNRQLADNLSSLRLRIIGLENKHDTEH